MKPVTRILSVLLGCMAVMLGAPAQADDSEVFTNASFIAKGVQPNVLFVIDTSGSMTTQVNVWDKTKTYTGDCPAGRIYWQTANTKTPPPCNSNQWISESNNRCAKSYATYSKNGWWNGRTMMLVKKDSSGKDINPTKWDSMVAGQDWKIECRDDKGVHGDDPANSAAAQTNKYAVNTTTGTADTARWASQTCKGKTCTDPTGTVTDAVWNANYVSLYTSSYINWYAGTDAGVPKTRYEIVSDVATDLINSLDGVNVGLARYSTTNQGGMITHAVTALDDTSRADMTNQLQNVFSPSGNTPLSETFYEAYLYYSGQNVKYGNSSKTADGDYKSVAASRVGNVITGKQYDSPADYSCQTNYIVYLTDGLPTSDVDANTLIDNLPGTTCAPVDPTDKSNLDGSCMIALAKYMHDTDLRSDVVGNQNVVTYMIGFGDDVASSKDFLDQVAAAGGSGQAYTQTDASGLKGALEKILTEVQESADTTFVAPAVSVNAFNRTQNLNELYMSVFAPTRNLHWPGNLKKYRIVNRQLYGAGIAAPAVDPATGYLAKGAQALNSPGVNDGPDTKVGGAASSLEDPAANPRKLYTYLETDTDLTASVNAFSVDNASLTSLLLGAVDDNDRTRIIQYTRGLDLNDEDKTSDFHHRMGDPMHSRPAVLIHGGTETAPLGTVFVATNDGVLHAFDIAHIPEPTNPVSAVAPKATTERWAFIPKDFIARQNQLFKDAPTANHRYALDGDVKVLKFDSDGDGIINGSDKAYVYFGTGRGGNIYYALDVTDITKPKFLWKIDSSTTGFTNMGRTWSTPQLGRIKIGDGSGQNKQLFVLVFGGGYDTRNDTVTSPYAYTTDTSGNSLYIVDAVSGKLLWSAGKSGTGYNFTDAKMTHSFPAPVAALDTDSDLFIDRIYAVDMDAKVWRFDVYNGNDVGTLVTGGVLASLGNGPRSTKDAANNRRFYNAPDVAPITVRGARPFMNIAIGSGYRGHPLNTDTQDRFYSIRDYDPYTPRDQSTYTDAAIITDDALVDVTDMTKSVTNKDPGWKINFNDPSWRGEKNLSDATTAAGVILFTTFTPLGEDPSNPCLSRSLNRAWGVYATSGDPFTHWIDGSTDKLAPADRHTDLNQNGIGAAVQVFRNPTDDGSNKGICNSGLSIFNRCVDFGAAVRTYWEHKQ